MLQRSDNFLLIQWYVVHRSSGRQRHQIHAQFTYSPISIFTSADLTFLFLQEVDETPDYTEDSDTNPNTTASSVVGEAIIADGRKRRSEATQLRRSVFGKKHDILGESKVCFNSERWKASRSNRYSYCRKTILFDDFDTYSA
jgi:hypothetical protein